MTTLERVQALLPGMTYREKLTLLGQITKDVHPGIEQTPGVCGVVACIAGTRIPVWVLVGYKKLGATDAVLLQAYPTLDAENLSHAWAYYRFHQDEINQQIAENENEDETDECTRDTDFIGQAQRIQEVLQQSSSLAGQLIRVNRPQG